MKYLFVYTLNEIHAFYFLLVTTVFFFFKVRIYLEDLKWKTLQPILFLRKKKKKDCTSSF